MARLKELRTGSMARLLLFYRLIVRPSMHDPWRALVMVFAVAVGVAVVLAIELAGNAAAGSFRSSVETLSGNTNLEVTSAGGVPDAVVGQLATLPYRLQIHPRIEDFAVISTTRQALPLVGLDLIGEVNSEISGQDISKLAESGPLGEIGSPTDVWVGASLGYKAGDHIPLMMNDHTRPYTVRGTFEDHGEGGSVIVMDIAGAEQELGRQGRVDRVLLKVPEDRPLEEWEKMLRTALPEGLTVRPQGSGTEENRKMLAAFRWNLRVLSYVALVVGAFLIYNTISVSVVRRRPEIGIVRALGASRSAVLLAFLGEAVCFGVAGALLALPLGRLLAAGAVKLLSATVDALYVSSRPGSLALDSSAIALALVIGVSVAVVSALSPAREASLVPPVEAMARAKREHIVRVHKWRDLWIALAMGAGAALASQAGPFAGKPLFGYLSGVLLIGALVFAIPAIVDALLSIASGLLQRLLGVEALLASRSLAGSLRRTSVLVGALATAIAMMTAVGIMVGSFRQTIVVWMNDQLPADLYLRPAGDEAADRHPTIALELVGKLEELPGVAAVDQFRAYEISYDGMPATLAGADLRVLHDFHNSDFVSRRPPAQVLDALRGEETAIVSEPFANKHHVKAGDTLTIPAGQRVARLRVVDIYYDYASERGVVIVDRATLLQYFPDPAPSNLAVYAARGADLATLRHEIEVALAGRNVLIFSNRDLRTEAIQIFDRTFAITYALEAVAIFVAVMGIAGALGALVMDRRRELGLLRFLGAAASQVRKMILVEAGLLGMLANIAGFGLGVLLSLVLIYVINKQSFGWTIQFHWPVLVLLSALTVVYAATVVAGLYPARVATQLNPIEVVHEE
jgi:putative ABC transport system permease protein